MKKTYTISATISVIFLLAFSSSPPNGRTGAPGETTCANCHGGNTPLQGSVEIEGLPDRIMGGTSYDITVRAVVSTGTGMRAGFQLVALDENNQNVGTLAEEGNNVGFETFNSRNYASHRSAKNFNGENEITYNFQWIAPEDKESGLVTMYAASVLANGNGSSGGDRVVTNSRTAEFEVSTSISDKDLSAAIVSFPNPAVDYVQFTWDSYQVSQGARITISNMNGTILIQQDCGIGSTQERIEIQSLASGIYLAAIEIDGRIATKKIIKM